MSSATSSKRRFDNQGESSSKNKRNRESSQYKSAEMVEDSDEDSRNNGIGSRSSSSSHSSGGHRVLRNRTYKPPVNYVSNLHAVIDAEKLNIDNSRRELWVIRAPLKFKPELLDGAKIRPLMETTISTGISEGEGRVDKRFLITSVNGLHLKSAALDPSVSDIKEYSSLRTIVSSDDALKFGPMFSEELIIAETIDLPALAKPAFVKKTVKQMQGLSGSFVPTGNGLGYSENPALKKLSSPTAIASTSTGTSTGSISKLVEININGSSQSFAISELPVTPKSVKKRSQQLSTPLPSLSLSSAASEAASVKADASETSTAKPSTPLKKEKKKKEKKK